MNYLTEPFKLHALGQGWVSMSNEPYAQARIGPIQQATVFRPTPIERSGGNHYLLESNGNCLGRAQIEDMSLMPKSVITVPGPDQGRCHVLVQEMDSGTYKLDIENGRMCSFLGEV